MELRWTLRALADLEAARDYIAQDSELAADAVATRLIEAVEYLAQHPNLGRSGRVRGTRELVVSGSPLIVVYRVRMDEVQILRVLHHAQKWP